MRYITDEDLKFHGFESLEDFEEWTDDDGAPLALDQQQLAAARSEFLGQFEDDPYARPAPRDSNWMEDMAFDPDADYCL